LRILLINAVLRSQQQSEDRRLWDEFISAVTEGLHALIRQERQVHDMESHYPMSNGDQYFDEGDATGFYEFDAPGDYDDFDFDDDEGGYF
jgi:hypothetical protein